MHHITPYELSNPIGIIGVVIILIAYFLISTGRWRSDAFIFQLINFVGAWMILYSLYFHWNLSSVIIEIAWIIISMIGMYRILTKKRRY
jgi:hypothetical protein